MHPAHVLGAIGLILLAVALALMLILIDRRPATGGAARRNRPRLAATRAERALRAPCVVVDTLNLVHWLRPRAGGKVTAGELAAAITTSAPQIQATVARQAHVAARDVRIVYVAKEVSPPLSSGEWAAVAAAAAAARADLEVARRVATTTARPARSNDAAVVTHAEKGFDDVYAAFRAHELHCAVASNDKFRDFGTVIRVAAPMVVTSYVWNRSGLPVERHLSPAGMSAARWRLAAPICVQFHTLIDSGS